MKVYLTYFNNGEPYEDNYEYVTGVYSTYDKAVKAIEDDGFELSDRGCWHKKQVWERRVMDEWYEDDEDEPEEYFTGIIEDMRIEEMEVQ